MGGAHVYALRLAKEGFWGGDPGRVLRAPCNLVLEALAYVAMLSEYERAYYEMNKSE